MAVPAPLGRRVPGREPGPVPADPRPAGDRRRPLRGRRPEPGHLRMERGRPAPARPPARPGPGHGGGPPGREPPVDAPGGGGGGGGPGPIGDRSSPLGGAADGPMPVVTAYDDEIAEAEGCGRACWPPVDDGRALVGTGRAGPHQRPAGRGAPGPGPGRHPPPDRPGPGGPTGEPGPGRARRNGVGGPERRGRAGAVVRPGRRGRTTPSSWPPSTGPRASSGTSVCVVGPGGRVRPHRPCPVAPMPGPRSAGCSTWPSPGPRGTCTARGPACAGDGRRPAVERQPSPWLAAVARVVEDRDGHGAAPRSAGDRIAEIRAGLEPLTDGALRTVRCRCR